MNYDAYSSSVIYRRWCAGLTLVGVLAVMAGCSMGTLRYAAKEHRRAEIARRMKPPLEESTLTTWWETNGTGAKAMAAAALSVWLAVKGRKG